MKKSELKENITKIEQVINSDNYEAGFQLLITINDSSLNAAMDDLIHTTLRKKYFGEDRSKEGLDMLSILFPKLTNLNLYRCESLKDIQVLSEFTDLTSLSLTCYEIQNIDSIGKCKHLLNLSLSCCYALQNLKGLTTLSKLTSLDLSWCKSLLDVDDLSNLKNLTSLSLRCCYELQNVDGLANLSNLTSLNLIGCDKVQPKPSKEEMTSRKEVAAYQQEVRKSIE